VKPNKTLAVVGLLFENANANVTSTQPTVSLVARPMAYRQKVSVSIDSELLAFIDNLTNNRSEVINEALVQWRKQKLQAALTKTEPDFGEENWLFNEQELQAEGIE
jgi:Arc/MetJ-type ribon-helix-helix transcriptional regulator